VDTEIPTVAAASARPTPLATAINAGATTDRGNLAAPTRHLPTQEPSRPPLEPALDIDNVGDQITFETESDQMAAVAA